MPALVNYGGDDEFHSAGSFYSELCCPSRKRVCVRTPFIFSESLIELNEQPSIDVLPDECLFEILRRLPSGRERSSSACVSKRWLTILSSTRVAEFCSELSVPVTPDVDMITGNEGLLTRCVEGKKASDIRLAAISVGTSGRGGLAKLSVRGSNTVCRVTDFGMSAVARGCPSLRALSLWNVPNVGDQGIVEIAKECTLLEKLDLCQCPSISNKGLIAIAENCPNLTSLNVESCPKIGNEGLQAIGQFCPNLQSLSIKNCPLVGDHGLSSLLSSASSVLSKVNLQALNVTDFSLAVIGHYGKYITSLVLCSLQSVSEKGFWVMGNGQGLQKLVSLAISSCRGITDRSLEAIGKGCTNLKHMCLRKCCFVSDQGLVALAKGAETLESLQLEECYRVTQSGIVGAVANCGKNLKSVAVVKCMGIKDLELGVAMPSPCNSLKSLSIRNCPGFGNRSLALLGKLCPQLEQLDLSGLHAITDAGLLPLIENCEMGLVKVTLSGCFNLTDNVGLALARLHGETLEVLNVEGCKMITDSSLAALAKGCMFLSDLDVSNCTITDFGVASLSHAEQLNLQVLSLSGCSQVSNKSMPFLKMLGKTLIGLNIQLCNSISGRTVEHLTESLWRCDILS